VRKYVLDSNCYIDAAAEPGTLAALQRFTAWAAPGLYLSSVVAAELRAGVRSEEDREALESLVLGPFVRRGRVVTPSNAAWDALGLALAALRRTDGLQLRHVSRSFALDILLAYSCRENGATLVTRNTRDMVRIGKVFAFAHVTPYPEQR
jgi:predicted nucleic acid-binding protein